MLKCGPGPVRVFGIRGRKLPGPTIVAVRRNKEVARSSGNLTVIERLLPARGLLQCVGGLG